MISRYVHLRSQAEQLRREGQSIGHIEKILCIPRSTLSGWFRKIALTARQKKKLYESSRTALTRARTKAVEWHKTDKKERIETIELSSREFLKGVDFNNLELIEIALAVLYLGEGSKKSPRTAMGASDPLMIRFFVSCLKRLYKVPSEKIKCELHLRHDQDEQEMKLFWSRELHIPLRNFTKTSFDKRTIGKPTYANYKGVCLVNCGKVEIQRRLMYIAKGFCAHASDTKGAISSVG